MLLGLYGQWQGTEDTGSTVAHLEPGYGVQINLGLIISNDGITFREPVPNFPFIPFGSEKSGWNTLRMIQAPAFVNYGDKTYIWYCGASNPNKDEKPHVEHHAEVGLATLPLDRFGCLQPNGSRAATVSQLLPSPESDVRMWLNVDGVDATNGWRVELLDAAFQPISGYSGQHAAVVDESGLRVPVKWGTSEAINLQEPFRARISLVGKKYDALKFYALYISPIA